MADKYWVGGSGTWDATATKWASTSGGTGGSTTVPTAADNVFFDQTGPYTVTLTATAVNCLDLNITGSGVTFVNTGISALNISGSVNITQAVTWTLAAFAHTTVLNATTTGKTLNWGPSATAFNTTINGTGGWSLTSAWTTGTTNQINHAQGTLTLNGFDLTTGLYASNVATARSVAFGSNYINLVHPTAATVVVNIATSTLFSSSGTGGFRADASVTRTYTVGTTAGGSATTTANLFITSGSAVPTITSGSWFKDLNFTGSSTTQAASTLNIAGSLTLATGGTYTALTINAVGTGTFTTNGKIIAALTVNSTSGTTTLGSALTLVANGTTTLTTGTLALNGFDLDTGIFASSGTAARAIAFGSGNILLTHTTAATTVLSFATATGFTWTGTGGFRATAAITRTYVFGTTGGTSTNAPNLTISSSGTAIAAITTGSWFNTLSFDTTAFIIAATTVNVNSLILSSAGTYTNLSVTMVGTGTLTNNGKAIAAFAVNNSAVSGIATLTAALTCTTYTQTSGTIDFAGFNLTASGAGAYTAGTLSNIGTITCTTWTVTGAFSLTQGTLTPSTSFVLTSGSFTYGPSGTLSAVPTFTHTAGTVSLNQNYALTATGTYTLVAGTLTLNDKELTTSAFITTGTGVRSIDFTGTYSQITLTGNAKTIWDGGGANITYTAGPRIAANYSGSTGTRTINIGTGWTEANAFDFITWNPGSYLAAGFGISYSGTDIVTVAGVVENFNLDNFGFTFTPGVLTVYGDYLIPFTGGTVSASANTTTFASTNATTRTVSIRRTIDSPVTFNGVGGSWNLDSGLTTGITRTVTLTSGTLNLGGDISAGLFSSASATARTLAFNTKTITVTGTGIIWDTSTVTNLTVTGTPVVNVANATATAATVNSGALPESQAISFNFTTGTYALTFLGTAGYTANNVDFTGFAGTLTATQVCTVYGGYIVSTGMTVTASANVLTFGCTTGRRYITGNGKTLPPITLNGIGGEFWLNSALTSSGTFQVLAGSFNTNYSSYALTCAAFDSSNATNTRDIYFNDATLTITGTAGITLNSTNLSFGGNLGSYYIYLTNATSTTINTVGSISFGRVIFNGAAPTITISTTGTNNYIEWKFTNGAAGAPSVVSISGTHTPGALSNLSTNATTRTILQSATPGTQVNVAFGGNPNVTDMDFKDINGSGGTTVSGTRVGNIGNNNNINFTTAKTVYWYQLPGGNWSSSAWALSSGGTPDINNFPLAQDTCVIGTVGLTTGQTITINSSNYYVGSIDISTRTTTMTLALGTNNLNVCGNWANSTTTTITGTGTVNFIGGTGVTQTLTSAGIAFTPNLNVASFGGIFRLAAALTLAATGTFTLTAGTLDLNTFALTTGIFSSNNANTRAITFGTANIILAHTTAGTAILSMANLTGFSYTGTGGFSTALSITRTFTCGTSGATSTNAPKLLLTSGAAVPTFTTTSTFGTLDFTGTTSTPAAATLNVNSLNLATGGTYTSLTINTIGTGTITPNAKTIVAFTVNAGSGTTTLAGALTVSTTFTSTSGTLNFGGFNLTCTTTASYAGGTFTSMGTLTCTTFTVSGGDFNPTSGTLTPTVSFVITGGAFTYGSGMTLSAVPTFTHTAGTVWFAASYSLTATGTYTFTSGSLRVYNTSSNQYLTCGIFSSSGTGTRYLQLHGYIRVTHTTSATTVLAMADVTNLTMDISTYHSPTPGFVTTSSVARTYTYGTTGGTVDNAINLSWEASGTNVAPVITTGSWFRILDFSAVTGAWTIAATAVNLSRDYTLNTVGTFTNLTVNLRGTGTVNNNGKSIGPLVVNSVGIYNHTGASILCTTLTVIAGELSAGGNVTCTGAAAFNGGTFNTSGVFTCTTLTMGGMVVSVQGGTWTPSTSVTITSGSLTIAGGTLSPVATFTQTAGNVTFNSNVALTATGTYTLTAGTLTLGDGVTLSTGIFSSSNTNIRSIVFGSSANAVISLTHTTAATTVLAMADVTNFTQSGPGGFTSAMGVTKTFTFGTTAGSVAKAVSLALISGAAIPTLTTNSWFKTLDFTGSTSTPATATLNVAGALTLASGGTYTGLSVNMVGTGTITPNGKTIAALVINTSGTATLFGALSCSTYTQTLGTFDFASYNLTCSSTATYTVGTLSNIGTIACTTFTLNGPTFDFNSGTINPSVSFVATSGSFSYGGTATLGAVPTFTQTAGSVTFNKAYALTATGTYTLTSGTLTLANGINLTTGIFSSTGTGTRAIAFDNTTAGNIVLAHTTAATTVLSMADCTNYTQTGLGSFVSAMSITRTFTAGTTAPGQAVSLVLNSGAAVPTITSGSTFYNLNFTGSSPAAFTTAISVNNNLTLSSGGTYTGLSITLKGSGTLTSLGKTIAALTINSSSTNTLADALTISGALTLTQGDISTNYNITSASFASTGSATRSITGSLTYTVTGSGATAFSNASATGITMPGTTINMTGTSAKTFAGGGASYLILNQGGGGALSITGANTFDNITNTVSGVTVTFPSATTQTFNNFSLSGSGSGGDANGYPLGSIALNGTTQYLTLATNAVFTFGTGNFTVEAWIKMNALTDAAIFDARTASTSVAPCVYIAASQLSLFVNNVWVIGNAGTNPTPVISINTWYHVAISRTSGVTRAFLNGVQVGNNYTDTNNYTSGELGIGHNSVGGAGTGWLNGNIANLRVTKGVGVYTGNFSVPTGPLSSTQTAGTNISAITGTQTSLLLNSPNSVNFIKDFSVNNFTLTNIGTITANAISPFLLYITASTPGTAATLYKSNGTVNVKYLSLQDSAATTSSGGWYAGSNSVNVSNNSGWNFSTFSTANFFNFLFF